jgi:hypothetical protein
MSLASLIFGAHLGLLFVKIVSLKLTQCGIA